jgi:hypothetical protein
VEEENTVLLRIKLDDSGYSTTLKGVSSSTGKFFDSVSNGAESSTPHFSHLAIGFIGVNQAIELGEKAVEAFKHGLETIEENSRVKNIGVSFDQLTKSIGVSGESMLTAMTAAADGSTSRLESMRLAAYALQNNVKADLVPQIMKASDALEQMGISGKSSEQIFQQITRAVSTGAFRSLKDLGVVIKDTGDRTENLNQVLAQIEGKYKSVEGKLDGTGQAVKRLQNVWTDFFDQMRIRSLPTLEKLINMLTQASVSTLTFLGLMKETPTMKLTNVESEIKLVRDSIAKLKKDREDLSKGSEESFMPKMTFGAGMGGGFAAAQSAAVSGKQKVVEIDKQLEEAEKRLIELETQKGAVASEVAAKTTSLRQNTQIEIMGEKAMKEFQAQAELQALYLYTEEDERAREASFSKRKAMLMTELSEETAQTATQHSQGLISAEEYKNRIVDIEQRKVIAIEQLERDRVQAERNQLLSSYTNWNGFANSVTVAMKQKLASVQSAGTVVVNGLAGAFTGFFEDLGAGADNAAGKLGKALLSMLGDLAIQFGTFMVLSGAFPPLGPNPGMIAAGVGLMALGGLVKGLSSRLGGSSSGSSSGSSGSSSGGSEQTSSGSSSSSASTSVSAEKVQTKSATIVVQGDYLETGETAARLAQIIRNNSDVTGFNMVGMTGQVA